MTNPLGHASESQRDQQAALMFDLIGGYVDGAPQRVAVIASQISATGAVDKVLNEAIRFTAYLTAQAERADLQLTTDSIRTAVLSRLTNTVPPHHELAVSAALDHLVAGHEAKADEALGDGPEGDLVALHALAAYTAELGLQLYAPGEFTAANLTIMSALVHRRA